MFDLLTGLRDMTTLALLPYAFFLLWRIVFCFQLKAAILWAVTCE